MILRTFVSQDVSLLIRAYLVYVRPVVEYKCTTQLFGYYTAASPDITASDFHNFFVDKIASVRASTDGASNPTFRPSPEDTVLNALKPVDLDELTSLISSLPNKHCCTDPLPTWLLKECTAELAPFICRLFNASLCSGHVPQSFKSAYITPLPKKAGLDNTDVKSYRPISNFRLFQRCWNASFLGGYLSISRSTVCFPVCSPPTGNVILRRPRWRGFYQTS